jgi:hypothetical protein
MLSAGHIDFIDRTEDNILEVINLAADKLNKDMLTRSLVIAPRVGDTMAIFCGCEGVFIDTSN